MKATPNTCMNQDSLKAGQSALIIGAGRSGMAAVRLSTLLGLRTTLLESAEIQLNTYQELQDLGVAVINDAIKAKYLEGHDYIIVSPGIPIATITQLLPDSPSPKPLEVLAEMELAWRMLQGEDVLAVTGTSGKTTTVSVAAAMLQSAGKEVFLGGNIGTPLSEYVLESKKFGHKAQVLVLEVSSFQLQGCSSFAPDVAMLLNISENHLDYHKDMQEYLEAKMKLFAKQQSDDIAVFPATLEALANQYQVQAQKVFFEKDEGNFPQKQLLGNHNALNIEAAWQACKPFGVSLSQAQNAVANFAPLPHRLEEVRNLHDVLYINDSKCTTVEALKVALEAFENPIILLCGGKFKGGDLTSLRPVLQKHVKDVLLFGDSREYFSKAWGDIYPLPWLSTLDEAVQMAQNISIPNDIVLLAPATASFDLYPNYIKRGEDFKAIVGALR